MNKVFELIFAPFIKAQQKAQEEVAPIIVKRYQSADFFEIDAGDKGRLKTTPAAEAAAKPTSDPDAVKPAEDIVSKIPEVSGNVVIMNPDQEYTPARRLISIRGKQFEWFANQVIEHIETYTVPQYGDYPNDQVEEWTPELCIAQIGKYSARFGKNSREGQELLDLIKIAHYAQIAYSKMKK